MKDSKNKLEKSSSESKILEPKIIPPMPKDKRTKEYKAWYRFDLHNLVAQIQNGIKFGNGTFKKLKVETVLLDHVRDQWYGDYLDSDLTDWLIKEIVMHPDIPTF